MFVCFSEQQQLFGKIQRNVTKIPFFLIMIWQRDNQSVHVFMGRHHVNMVLSRYDHPLTLMGFRFPLHARCFSLIGTVKNSLRFVDKDQDNRVPKGLGEGKERKVLYALMSRLTQLYTIIPVDKKWTTGPSYSSYSFSKGNTIHQSPGDADTATAVTAAANIS